MNSKEAWEILKSFPSYYTGVTMTLRKEYAKPLYERRWIDIDLPTDMHLLERLRYMEESASWTCRLTKEGQELLDDPINAAYNAER